MPTLSADVEVSILHTMKMISTEWRSEWVRERECVLLYWSLFMFCCNYPLTNVVAGPDRIRKIKTLLRPQLSVRNNPTICNLYIWFWDSIIQVIRLSRLSVGDRRQIVRECFLMSPLYWRCREKCWITQRAPISIEIMMFGPVTSPLGLTSYSADKIIIQSVISAL